MTISSYHIDGVISAYNKKSKIKINAPVSLEGPEADQDEDVVPLSHKGSDRDQAYQKISYSIIDVILKKRKI